MTIDPVACIFFSLTSAESLPRAVSCHPATKLRANSPQAICIIRRLIVPPLAELIFNVTASNNNLTKKNKIFSAAEIEAPRPQGAASRHGNNQTGLRTLQAPVMQYPSNQTDIPATIVEY
jgi:hypothetical protein